MPTFDEQEHLVRQLCKNTGASDRLARDVLRRNKWKLQNSYKEMEQMCVSSNRGSVAGMPPPGPYPQQEYLRTLPRTLPAATSRGGMEGGVGPAVTLDIRGIRPQGRGVSIQLAAGNSVPQIVPVQGLKVALPPVRAPVERVIPIQVEGGRMEYQSQPSANAETMARVTLNEKVLPSQPAVVAPKMSSVSKPQIGDCAPSANPPPASHTPESYPRLKRGFSNIMENESLVSAARSSVLQDIKEDNHHQMFMTFVLPDLTIYPEDFRAFLRKELIESSTLNSLQLAGRLNWWAQQGLCQRLIPMATSGDGNCLLHAASLAMWGIHDRLLTLRMALHDTLTKADFKDRLYRRWRWQQTHVNQQSGLVCSEAEWKTEWENIIRLASPSPRSGPDTGTNSNSCCDSPITSSSSASDSVVYESLEEFHVFVLAHVLKRTIIVVADTILRDANGEALAPIPFGGIYLPLECNNRDCYTSPLLLTYDAAHFSALVPMQHSSTSAGYDSSVPLAIPVVDPQLKLLPLHFYHDPGANFDWNSLNNKGMAETCLEDRLNLIKAYMDIEQLPLYSDSPLIKEPNLASRQSSAGSTGSEEGGGLNSGTLKDKKKDGKPNTVAKQFGSLGKSMGKKLKNLGNNLAPSKPVGKGGGVDGEKGQQASLGGGLTQSTKVITALATTAGGDNEELVYCAKLSCESEDTREVFVRNYLTDAQKRFNREQEQKRQRGEDPRQRAVAHPPGSVSQICRTSGCNHYAIMNLPFCERCTTERQWQQGGTLDNSASRGHSQQSGYNTFPGRHKAPTGLPSNTRTTDEIYKCGKSKFYTPLPQTVPEPQRLQVLRPTDRQQSMSTGNVARAQPVPRPRSPSPDYDNLQTNPKCATPGCDFYGSKELGNLCSGCYKNKPQLAKPEKTTKL